MGVRLVKYYQKYTGQNLMLLIIMLPTKQVAIHEIVGFLTPKHLFRYSAEGLEEKLRD